MYERGIIARPLILPGIELIPGDLVIVIDSRGRAVKGIFMGYAAGFVGLSNECNKKPNRFINIRRINEVLIIKERYCVKIEFPSEGEDNEGEGGAQERGDGTPDASA